MLLLTAASTAILQTQMALTKSTAMAAFVLLIFAGALALMRLADRLTDRGTPATSLSRALRPVRSFQGPLARRV
jgi:hypothetical protein